MNFSSVQFNLNSAAEQPQIIELLKRERRDYIQTSNGLCVKGAPQEIQRLFEQNAIKDITVTTVDNPTPDIQAFVEGRGL